jgi:hypothetical protein
MTSNPRPLRNPILLLAAWVALSGASCGGSPRAIQVERAWQGEVCQETAKLAPASGHVAGAESWSALWQAFRPGEPVPAIDFERELVLVVVGPDPNHIRVHEPHVSDGDLQFKVVSTAIGYKDPKTCGYQFAAVKRDGVRTIHGKRVAGN